MTHHGETTKRRQIINNHETKTNIYANTIPTEKQMPATPQELAERSLHRLPVPLGKPFVAFGWFPLRDSVDSDNMFFLCEHMRNEHE